MPSKRQDEGDVLDGSAVPELVGIAAAPDDQV